MSRCFPFPPPGYEKKPTTDEPDLLKKEKRKEKKHKKDKKDKEKRDGKEKREKDRSDGKHKEKKDKKDKHRDKKKDKEKGKSGISDEKKIHGQFEGFNGENLLNNEKPASSSDKKSCLQFQNGEYNEQILNKEKNSSLENKKSPIFCGQNGDLLARNTIKAEDTENFKFVQELGRRIRDEEKGTGGSHQFAAEGRKNHVNKIEIQKPDWRQEAGFGRNVAVQNKINGAPPPPPPVPPQVPPVDKKIDEKEKMQEKEGDDKRGGKRKNKDRDKEKAQKKSERDKNKHIMKTNAVASFSNVPARPPENSFQGVGIEGNLKKRKDIETNGISHENELRPNKMARHISNISPENGKKLDFLQNPGSSFKVGSKDQRVNGVIASPPGLVAAKKPPVSGFNHIAAKPPTPIKSPPVITNHIAAQPLVMPTTKPPPSIPNHIATQLPRPTTKPPPSIPNHITAQPQSPPPPTKPVSQPKPPPSAIANKLSPPPPPIPKKKPPPPPPPPPAAEPSTKPPHPDTKYLNQILSIPKLDQWCGFDDQEWLFSGKSDQASKKTTMEEAPVQVWSEAKHIESLDVCALPYVIPY